jgi:hypothetical protein
MALSKFAGRVMHLNDKIHSKFQDREGPCADDRGASFLVRHIVHLWELVHGSFSDRGLGGLQSQQPVAVAMPFKHNSSRRHLIGKMKFKVTEPA